MGVYTTRHWQTSSRLVLESNVCTVLPESATTEYDISTLGTAMHVYRLPFRVECTVSVGLHVLASMLNYKWE